MNKKGGKAGFEFLWIIGAMLIFGLVFMKMPFGGEGVAADIPEGVSVAKPLVSHCVQDLLFDGYDNESAVQLCKVMER